MFGVLLVCALAAFVAVSLAAEGALAAATGRGNAAWLNPARGTRAEGVMARRAAVVVPPPGVSSSSAANPILDSCRELAATCTRDNGRCMEAFEELNCALVLAANSDGKDACACADQCPRGWRCYEYYQALGCYAPPSPCPPKPPSGSSEGALIGVLAGIGGAWVLLALVACLMWAFGGRRHRRHHHHHGDYRRLRTSSAAYASAASSEAARRQAHAQRYGYASNARLRRPLAPAAAAPLQLFGAQQAIRRPPAR